MIYREFPAGSESWSPDRMSVAAAQHAGAARSPQRGYLRATIESKMGSGPVVSG